MHGCLKVLKGRYYAQKTEYIRIPSGAAPEFRPLLVMKKCPKRMHYSITTIIVTNPTGAIYAPLSGIVSNNCGPILRQIKG